MIVKSIVLVKENVGHLDQIKTEEPCVIVVRAEKKLNELFNNAVTEQLYNKSDASGAYDGIRAYFAQMDCGEPFMQTVDKTLESISNYLAEGMIFRSAYDSFIGYVLTRCASLCARFVAEKLSGTFVEGSDMIVCREENGTNIIDWQASVSLIRRKISGNGLEVVSGGYGRTSVGYSLNLGHIGADLLTSAIGSETGARQIEFYSNSKVLKGMSELTYQEATQLCAATKGPFYPAALWPAVKKGIPVIVRNMLDLSDAGTTISAKGGDGSKGNFTGVVSESGLDLITIYGSGMLQSIGMSSSVFGVMAKNGINIRFISQSSSEYSISFAIRHEDNERAMAAISTLISDKQLLTFNDLVCVDKKVSIISVCGDKMRNIPGVSGKVFTALGNAGINVIASAQGGEELSISIVVDEDKADEALAALKSMA